MYISCYGQFSEFLHILRYMFNIVYEHANRDSRSKVVRRCHARDTMRRRRIKRYAHII